MHLTRGDVLLWVGIQSASFFHIRWQTSIRHRGIRRVWYNSEPQLNDSSLRPRCLKAYYRMAQHDYVDEIWDYSAANIDACRETLRVKARNASVPVLRHLPPGAVETNVSAACKRAAPRRAAVFLGMVHVNSAAPNAWGAGFRRRASCYQELQAALGTKRLSASSDTFTWPALTRLLASTRLFLNLHKWCAAPGVTSPVEALRLSPMLSAGAPVVSESVHDADRALYDGLVTFAAWAQLAAAVRQQLDAPDGSWCAEAEERAREFRRRFAPVALLRRAGVVVGEAERQRETVDRGGSRRRATPH